MRCKAACQNQERFEIAERGERGWVEGREGVLLEIHGVRIEEKWDLQHSEMPSKYSSNVRLENASDEMDLMAL